jgi:hypothetical protein
MPLYNPSSGSGVGGSGTAGAISKFSDSSTLANSILTESGTVLTLAGSASVAGGTVTANAPSLSITKTWNNGAVSFNEILIDITSTANGSSTFIDCYDDTVRRFWVSNGGTVNATQVIAGGDAVLLRDAANTWGIRNGTTAQGARIYNTYTDASNYERGLWSWVSNILRIGTEKLGTGVARAMEFITDGTVRMTIGTTGVVSISGDQIQIATAKTPSSATDTGTAGAICRDASYIYVCTATNTWKRAAIATW